MFIAANTRRPAIMVEGYFNYLNILGISRNITGASDGFSQSWSHSYVKRDGL